MINGQVKVDSTFSQTDTSYHLFVEAIAINILIFSLVVLTTESEWVATIGGLVIIGYIFFTGLLNPKEAIYLFFGIKLTFDALWEIKIFELAGLGKIGLLELAILPVILLSFFGNKMSRSVPKWPIVLIIIYLAWVFCAMFINEDSYLDFNLLVRQACLLLGLIIGLRYIETIEDFQRSIYLVFLSTLAPVLVAALQGLIGSFIDLPFFHYKFDNVREYRLSGLFYDAGTMGMVVIISLASNLYLLQSGFAKRIVRTLHFAFLPICLFVAIAGGTRSIAFISSIIVILFFVSSPRKAILVIPLIIVTISFTRPALDEIFTKTGIDSTKQPSWTNLLNENEYRTMFTGRVGLWQDVWAKHKSGSWKQILFGTGLSSNAHSTYFFLLLQIGWLGLLFYLSFHVLVTWLVLRLNIQRMLLFTVLGILLTNLLLGISLTTVSYTSFQIAYSFILGAGISIGYQQTSHGWPHVKKGQDG